MCRGGDTPIWILLTRLDYAGWVDKIGGESYPDDNGFYKVVRYEPLGVCAGIASWNATFLYIGWKIAPAVAAGNCVCAMIYAPQQSTNLRPSLVYLQAFRKVPIWSYGLG